MNRFNTQTRFIPLKIDKDFNVEHIQSKDGKIKDFKTRKAVEKYCKENHCIYCEEKYIFYKWLSIRKKPRKKKNFARLNFIVSNYSNHSGCGLHSLSNTENDYPRPRKPKSPWTLKSYLDIRFFAPAANDYTRHASGCIRNSQYQTIASPMCLPARTPPESYHIWYYSEP